MPVTAHARQIGRVIMKQKILSRVMSAQFVRSYHAVNWKKLGELDRVITDMLRGGINIVRRSCLPRIEAKLWPGEIR